MTPSARLTKRRFAEAVAILAAGDRDLARIRAAHGPPPMWRRPRAFASLVFLIIEQQVSLASARATYARLAALAGAVTPAALAALDDAAMRAAGVSRQKVRYLRALAEAVAARRLDLDRLARLDDEAARAALTALPGIGEWTADVFLLEALGRPDVWPAKDLALAVAVHEVKGLTMRPDAAALLRLGEAWRPWRAVAACFFWHYYLSTKRPRRIAT